MVYLFRDIFGLAMSSLYVLANMIKYNDFSDKSMSVTAVGRIQKI